MWCFAELNLLWHPTTILVFFFFYLDFIGITSSGQLQLRWNSGFQNNEKKKERVDIPWQLQIKETNGGWAVRIMGLLDLSSLLICLHCLLVSEWKPERQEQNENPALPSKYTVAVNQFLLWIHRDERQKWWGDWLQNNIYQGEWEDRLSKKGW